MRAYLTPMDTGLPYKQLKWLKRALDRNPSLAVRHIDMSRYDEEFAAMTEIWRQGWKENWGSIPPTDAESKYLAEEMKLDHDPGTGVDRHHGRRASRVLSCATGQPPNEMIRDLKGQAVFLSAG